MSKQLPDLDREIRSEIERFVSLISFDGVVKILYDIAKKEFNQSSQSSGYYWFKRLEKIKKAIVKDKGNEEEYSQHYIRNHLR